MYITSYSIRIVLLSRYVNIYDTMAPMSTATTSSQQQGEEQHGNQIEHAKSRAVRFTEDNKHKRFDVDHSIIGAVPTTHATPIDRGAKKNIKNPGREYEAYKNRCDGCKVGKSMRVMRQMADGTIDHIWHNCDLCGSQGQSWMCRECWQILCFDADRTEKIKKMLQSDEHGDRL